MQAYSITQPRWMRRPVTLTFRNRVKEAAVARWPLCLRTLGIPPELLDGESHRCFVCGGQFKFLDDGRGSFVCRGPRTQGLGKARDGFDLLSHISGMSFSQAVRAVAGTLGLEELEQEPVARAGA